MKHLSREEVQDMLGLSQWGLAEYIRSGEVSYPHNPAPGIYFWVDTELKQFLKDKNGLLSLLPCLSDD
jgi:hypothetical protein